MLDLPPMPPDLVVTRLHHRFIGVLATVAAVVSHQRRLLRMCLAGCPLLKVSQPINYQQILDLLPKAAF